MTVLISGGGIAGLVLGLSLHEIGVPFHILERVKEPKPLGVGINLQPPAVRELIHLGLQKLLDHVGLPTQDYGFYTRTGLEIWTEPRGRHAGYNWSQYSVHRGRFQMALLEELHARCGSECISFGAKALHVETEDDECATLFYAKDGRTHQRSADLVVGADGIHSALRAQMYPDEGAPVWGGAIMWRGTSDAPAFLTGASMVLCGDDHVRFVAYPITAVDPQTKQQRVNWIAEKRVDPSTSVEDGDWNRQVATDRFAASFDDWNFDWINIPDLISNAEAVYEYPMIDRTPVESWTKGRATLIGDAAHATYPVGSSGASQAILDARILTAEIQTQGVTQSAALSYEKRVRPIANAVTLANRSGKGPDAIMQLAQDRCEGDFSRLDHVLPMEERSAFAEEFKKRAGLSVAQTNAVPGILKI